MKAHSKLLLLSSAVVCLLLFGACADSVGEDKVLYLFIDLTEIEENGSNYDYLESSIDSLTGLLGQGGSGQMSRAGASVYIFPIYDFPLNKPFTAHLERGSRNQNALDRRDAVRKFEQELRSGIQAVVETHLKQRPSAETYRQSHIFGPVCEGLKGIQRQGAPLDKRRVVIFSDMLENSSIASFYQGSVDPDSLAAALDARCALPDLSGVCMNIVYQPLKKKSALVLEARSFWINFLESKGLPTATPSCFSYESYL